MTLPLGTDSALRLSFVVILAAFAALVLPSAAQAAPTVLWQVPEAPANGSGAGQIENPRGLAVDPASGDVYVGEGDNARIGEFTAWGEFIKAFGWKVNSGSPEEKLQTCTKATGCQAGSEGGGQGQQARPNGIAVGAAGGVYVFERGNHRVEEFDSSGNFVLTFGGKVNKTKVEAAAPEAEQNRCPIDPGDVCQVGSPGSGNGQFATEATGTYIAIAPAGAPKAGTIYVGDENRIQEFTSEGVYEGQISLPKEEEGLKGAPKEGKGLTQSLAVGPSGELYFDFTNSAYIYKHTVSGWAVFAEVSFREHALEPADHPSISQALGVDAHGDLYAVNDPPGFGGIGREPRVLEFDSAGSRLIPTAEEDEREEEEAENPTPEAFPFAQVKLVPTDQTGIPGLATSSACGILGTDLYVSYFASSASLLRAYGSHPDPALCPPPKVDPSIADQYAASVDREGATLRARINSHFWPDTTYYAEYGSGKCSEGGCTSTAPVPPGSALGSESNLTVNTKGVFLSELQPGATYHYRFVARTEFGPGEEAVVRGVGGKVGEDGEEGTFITAPGTLPPKVDCENQAYRVGLSATLPDCRAYEMVSPVDKEGGDILALLSIASWRAALDQSSSSGDRMTYSAYRPFGEALSGPYTSQYIATRAERGQADEGWSSRDISPPRGRPLLETAFTADTEFKAFSPDLCQGWLSLGFEAEPQLAPGEVTGFPNLYRDRLCGEAGYEALTDVEPPDADPRNYNRLELQGTAADGAEALFVAPAKLTDSAPAESPECAATGNECEPRLYEASAGGALRFVCVLPDGANAHSCVAATAKLNPGVPGRQSNLTGAISADGSRVYWSESGPSKIELSLNPTAPPSARLDGAASGKGNTIGPATGKGDMTKFSKTIANLSPQSGAFAVGQQISAANGGLPAGTTIEAVGPGSLTLSAEATKTKTEVEIVGAASKIVTGLVTESGAFQAGQEISGEGIPSGAEVSAVDEGEGKLTLSATATQTKPGASLAATSPCTEADAKACTIVLSGPLGSESAQFWVASPDGDRAIFSTNGKLYEEEVTLQAGTPIATPTLIAASASGVLGASEDATRVYFASTEALATGATGGQNNLYFREAGAPPRFVGTLSAADVDNAGISARPIAALTNYRAARVSPDGLDAAFTSNSAALAEQAAGYDNADQASAEADGEVYLYEAAAEGGQGRLLCVSCNPSGARPSGRQLQLKPWEQAWVASLIPPPGSDLYASKALSADGRGLFFDSYEALLPRDTDGSEDVYEWQSAASQAQCEEAGAERYVASAAGCLSLISSGKSAQDSEFLDASPSGSDVFFATGASLVPQDPGLVDVYDAREGGGFAPPQGQPAGCQGEACQPAATAPNDLTPASSSFQGVGNVVEQRAKSRCTRGKARRQGRCVAKKRKRGRHHHRRANGNQRTGR